MGSSNTDNKKPNEPATSISDTNPNEQTDKENGTTSEMDEEDLPSIQINNEFEKSVWKIVDKSKGELISIETVDSEDSDEISIIAAVLCENNEEVVNSIINEVKDITISNESKVSTIITFGDIKKVRMDQFYY